MQISRNKLKFEQFDEFIANKKYVYIPWFNQSPIILILPFHLKLIFINFAPTKI